MRNNIKMTDTRLSNDVPDHSDETHASTTIRTSTLSKIQPDVSRLGFTDLPSELRLMIYRHAFPEDEIHIVVYGNRAHPYHEQTSNLLHLNRQIAQEIEAICIYVVHIHLDVLADQRIQNHTVSKSQEICKLLVQANRTFTVRIELENWLYSKLRHLLKSLPGCKIEIKIHTHNINFDTLIRRVEIWKESGVIEASVTVICCQEQGMKCYRYLWGS